jgi:hypothetical protein
MLRRQGCLGEQSRRFATVNDEFNRIQTEKVLIQIWFKAKRVQYCTENGIHLQTLILHKPVSTEAGHDGCT